MTWTIFEHNFGPNETDYKNVVVNAGRETAISWWEQHYDADPTRYDGWPDTDIRKAWDITEVADEEAVFAEFPDIELESGGIGSPKTRPTRMRDLHEDNRTLVMQEPTLREEVDLPDDAEDTDVVPDREMEPENAGVGESDVRGPPDHSNAPDHAGGDEE